LRIASLARCRRLELQEGSVAPSSKRRGPSDLQERSTPDPASPGPERAGSDTHERIIRTAYELFTQNGLNAVGVDRIVADAGVAKTTLYRHFRSKDELIVQVIERHSQLWLRNWLEPETSKRANSPADRLLAVFDSLDEWFGDENFQGCLPLNSLVETHDRTSPVRGATHTAIGGLYTFLERVAVEATDREPERLARQIHLLVLGAIVAATDRNPEAGRDAREAARQLIARGTSHD
jgi:AcrR family transcriptional regulator